MCTMYYITRKQESRYVERAEEDEDEEEQEEEVGRLVGWSESSSIVLVKKLSTVKVRRGFSNA